MTDRSTTAKWKRSDGASITAIDSYSWLPLALADIGEAIGMFKLPDPKPDDTEGWYLRCEQDVAIMRTAMLDLATFVEDADLGTWQRTGAAMAWTAYRHKFMDPLPVVHDSQDIQQIEHDSIYAHRCEAWRHGRHNTTIYYEWDIQLNYARVCSTVPLPYSLVGRVRPSDPLITVPDKPNVRRLYYAYVSTDVPVLPVKDETGIYWPIGTFRGWYWDRELAVAEAEGASITITEWIEYRSALIFKAFADWCLDRLVANPQQCSSVQRIAIKHWTRALVGKTGAQYEKWVSLGKAPSDEISLTQIWNADTQCHEKLMMAGGEAFYSEGSEYGQDSIPSIFSAVTSECRIWLWLLMRTAGLDNVLYCDTDGIIVNPSGSRNLEHDPIHVPLVHARVKHEYESVWLYGPKQLMLDGHAKWSGIPKKAKQIDSLVWKGERWETLGGAFEHGNTNTVHITPMTWTPKPVDKRRVHIDQGRTEARVVGLP